MDIKNQVLLKLRLEKTFKRELNTIFNFMLINFKVSAFRRETFNVYDFQSLWRDLLLKHYRRVQKNFRNIDSKKELDMDEQNIQLALDTWSFEMADKVADNITRTSLDDVRKAMISAQEESEERLDATALILAAIVILRRRFKSRKNLIATTETNGTAENTKLIEKRVKTEVIVEGVVVSKLLQKVWQNVGDARVRDAHRAAGGQTRMLNEPFNVGGELLMYPGDRSLGASIWNIANCRCTLTYI